MDSREDPASLVCLLVVPVKCQWATIAHWERIEIPVQGLVLHFRSSLLELPAEDNADVLHQVASDLDVTDVCRVESGVVVVVLHDACGVVI